MTETGSTDRVMAEGSIRGDGKAAPRWPWPTHVPTLFADPMTGSLNRWTRWAFLALVALLPLHTVFLRWEIAWKPWLILLIVVVLTDLWESRGRPWPTRAVIGVGVFLVAMLVSWPGPEAGARFWRLWLALAAGGLLLLSVGKHAKGLDDVLRVVFWSAAGVALTAMVVMLFTNGLFGEDAVSEINEIVLVERVNKPAYLSSGFVALTNWHQDPGYSALWTNVWLVLSGFAWLKGLINAPRWVGPLVLGGLVTATLFTYSRTGWVGLFLALTVLVVSHTKADRQELIRAGRLVLVAVLVAVGLVAVQIAIDPPGVGGDILTAADFRFAYIGELGAIDLGEEGVVDPDLVVPDNRVDVWNEYADRFLENPIRGIGLGTGWGESGLQEPHNMWLEILAETGIIGLFGFLFLLGSLGRRGGVVAGTVLVVIFVATMTQTVLFEPILWLGLGLWLAGSTRTVEARVAEAVS